MRYVKINTIPWGLWEDTERFPDGSIIQIVRITGYTPYLYDTFSTTKPIDIGFRLELTPKDAVSVSWTIDAKNGNVDHRYYTYYRDMHSFYGWIRYDTVEKKTTFMIMPKDFRF